MKGDAINAVLCGAGHNLRKILATTKQWPSTIRGRVSDPACRFERLTYQNPRLCRGMLNEAAHAAGDERVGSS